MKRSADQEKRPHRCGIKKHLFVLLITCVGEAGRKSVERAPMKAIQIQAFGRPTDVAQCADIIDVGATDANEVVITLEASP
jgi:hypothetical protein